MTVQYQRPGNGHYVVHELSTWLCRDKVTLNGGDYDSGTVLCKVTSTDQYTQFNPSANDGSEVPAGILYTRANATDETKDVVMTSGLTAVHGKCLVWPETITAEQQQSAMVSLRQLNIKCV